VAHQIDQFRALVAANAKSLPTDQNGGSALDSPEQAQSQK
jgi:hypothetical protein